MIGKTKYPDDFFKLVTVVKGDPKAFVSIATTLRLPPRAGMGLTSVGHVSRYTDLIGCVLALLAVGRGAY